MAYSGEPATSALAKRLVTVNGQLCLQIDGVPVPVPVAEDRVDAVMAEIEWRSANARKISVGAGVACLIAIYACLFRGLEWWEPLPWCGGAWLALAIAFSVYMGAPLRTLMRDACAAQHGPYPGLASNARSGCRRALAERRGQMRVLAIIIVILFARWISQR